MEFCISVLYICFSCTGLHVLFISVNVDVHGTVLYMDIELLYR